MVAIGWKGSRNRCQKAVVVVAEHRSPGSFSALILQIARSSEQYEQPSWQGPSTTSKWRSARIEPGGGW